MAQDTSPLSSSSIADPVTAPATVTSLSQTVTTTGTETWQWPHFDDLVKAGLAYLIVGGYVFSYLYGQHTGHYAPDGERANYSNFVMLALGFYLGAALSNLKSKVGL